MPDTARTPEEQRSLDIDICLSATMGNIRKALEAYVAGADINARAASDLAGIEGNPPINLAISGRSTKLVDAMLALGAATDILNNEKETTLERAADYARTNPSRSTNIYVAVKRAIEQQVRPNLRQVLQKLVDNGDISEELSLQVLSERHTRVSDARLAEERKNNRTTLPGIGAPIPVTQKAATPPPVIQPEEDKYERLQREAVERAYKNLIRPLRPDEVRGGVIFLPNGGGRKK